MIIFMWRDLSRLCVFPAADARDESRHYIVGIKSRLAEHYDYWSHLTRIRPLLRVENSTGRLDTVATMRVS
jgi:hypothetical protein